MVPPTSNKDLATSIYVSANMSSFWPMSTLISPRQLPTRIRQILARPLRLLFKRFLSPPLFSNTDIRLENDKLLARDLLMLLCQDTCRNATRRLNAPRKIAGDTVRPGRKKADAP